MDSAIICGDSLEVLKQFDDNSIDFAVFSPPYDDLRDYKGFRLDLPAIGVELYRVMKDGGVVAMVINDKTENLKKTLTTFRTIVNWVDVAGFNLSECVIYKRWGVPGSWKGRFRVDHEYLPIFFKGKRPAYFDKSHLAVPTLHPKAKWHGTKRQKDGTTKHYDKVHEVADTKCRGTVWEYTTSNAEGNKLKMRHPATYPDKLAEDLIRCYSREGEVVLDIFGGSGTTAVQAAKNNRKYIHIDISHEYCQIAIERLEKEANVQRLSPERAAAA